MIALMTKAPTASEAIAAAVRKYRQQRDWSVRELAEKCASLGATTLTQASLTNIERGLTSGRRGSRAVTVDELLVLAYVLDVPPALLMLPLGDANHVEICPGIDVDPYTALQWLVGNKWITDGRTLENAIPGAYDRAVEVVRYFSDIDIARRAAEWPRQMLHGPDEPLVQARRRMDALWKDNPDSRGHYERLADTNNRPRPGLPISDAEFVEQWRKMLPATYKARLREYVDALWRAADAGLRALPPVPRDLYVDIMKITAEEAPPGWRWDIDPLTGLPREVATPARPALPPDILVLDGGEDGDR